MTDEGRSLELEVDVLGTPDEVWRAIATGPGISSWYVPHTVEERTDGAATARFGTGPEMEVPGRVAVWEPPTRIVFDGGETGQSDAAEGMAFEWLVRANDAETCTVRLVNSGFTSGPDGDAMYDAMDQGWKMFLSNLALHLEHFGGQSATASLPTRFAPGSGDDWWRLITDSLGVSSSIAIGDRVELDGGDDLHLAGSVVDLAPTRLSLLVDQPVAGTAFVAVEPMGDEVSVSIWSYLYGDEGADRAALDEPRWQTWLDALTLT